LAELSDAGVSSAGDPTCSLSDEAELLNELETLKAERLSLRSEHERLVSEISNLDEAELRLFEEYHKFSIDLDHLSGEHLSLQNSLLASTDRLERLKRVNVFDDTFHISTDGHFGTINGFRLGTLPGSQPVEWNEINAALGHSCLLLATLAKRCSFKFSKFVSFFMFFCFLFLATQYLLVGI
jgi:beclin 1